MAETAIEVRLSAEDVLDIASMAVSQYEGTVSGARPEHLHAFFKARTGILRGEKPSAMSVTAEEKQGGLTTVAVRADHGTALAVMTSLVECLSDYAVGAAEAATTARLESAEGDGGGDRVSLEKAEAVLLLADGEEVLVCSARPFVVGRDRSAADWVPADQRVSRRHFRITANAAAFEIDDLASSNGTFVNGARVREATRLEDGDVIEFGRSRVAFAVRGLSGAGITS